MNIFYLCTDPTNAARYQCDRHVVKMILETAQLLSTAHRVLDGDERADRLGLYKCTHKNHPSAVWVRSSKSAYCWAYDHLRALCKEYEYRYGKTHKTASLLDSFWCLPMSLPEAQWIDPPQCMPDAYKRDNVVDGYRFYYALDKASNDWFKYNKTRSQPKWLITHQSMWSTQND